MARYFFNMHDGISIPDTIGSEHPDLDSVRSEAVGTIGERLKGTLLEKGDVTAWVLNVLDEWGSTVLVFTRN